MKKILSGLLTVCLLVSMLAVADTPIKAEAASTSGSLEQRITQLQKKFPNGKYWNHSGSFVNNPDGWTDTPCTHHGNCLAKGYQGQCGCNSFSNAIQCMGFSEKLGYDVFGSAPRTWSSHTNLSKVKAGDVIRYRYNTHSVFVTKVTADTITFADCNWDGHCKIRWNVTIPKSSITGLTYIRHANNYDSVVKIPQTVKLTTARPGDAPHLPAVALSRRTAASCHGQRTHGHRHPGHMAHRQTRPAQQHRCLRRPDAPHL